MPALYVIRHGEPAVTGVLTGQSDPPLSAEGRRQAAQLTAPATTVYSSPLRRAFETALFLHPQPTVLPGLAEISYGLWDGLEWKAIEREWPNLSARKLENWQSVIPPKGETWEGFADRVTQALRVILAGPLPAAMVAHEAVNAMVAFSLEGVAPIEYKQGFCETRTYDIPTGR